MQQHCAVLIGFQDQDNLGVGYLAALLETRGYPAHIVDFRQSETSILAEIEAKQPTVVGFSLIFQYYLPQLAFLAKYLRANGVDSLFCVGGHYPTLCSRGVLEAVPELDCVVRGEGEMTLLELMARLAERKEWRDIPGIAYCRDGECIVNTPRPLVGDLDALPYPVRGKKPMKILGNVTSPILASRGCSRECSFCSIREFYRQSPGKAVRVRKPASVAEEMEFLRNQYGTSIFIFQDDDFPSHGDWGKRWVSNFIDSLEGHDLANQVLWKVSSRADEIDPFLIDLMSHAGMYMVYMGIESGTPAGLRVLNKHLSVSDSLKAVDTIRRTDVLLAFGFMLFDPSSTFESVRENVAFLRRITEGVCTAISFGRMLPFSGTPIEKQLLAEGRLTGGVENPDYPFLDSRLNSYFEILNAVLAPWIQSHECVANLINSAWQEYFVARRFLRSSLGLGLLGDSLRSVTADFNRSLLNLVEESSRRFERDGSWVPDWSEQEPILAHIRDRVMQKRDTFILGNQDLILSSLQTHYGQQRTVPPACRVG